MTTIIPFSLLLHPGKGPKDLPSTSDGENKSNPGLCLPSAVHVATITRVLHVPDLPLCSHSVAVKIRTTIFPLTPQHPITKACAPPPPILRSFMCDLLRPFSFIQRRNLLATFFVPLFFKPADSLNSTNESPPHPFAGQNVLSYR